MVVWTVLDVLTFTCEVVGTCVVRHDTGITGRTVLTAGEGDDG